MLDLPLYGSVMPEALAGLGLSACGLRVAIRQMSIQVDADAEIVAAVLMRRLRMEYWEKVSTLKIPPPEYYRIAHEAALSATQHDRVWVDFVGSFWMHSHYQSANALMAPTTIDGTSRNSTLPRAVRALKERVTESRIADFVAGRISHNERLPDVCWTRTQHGLLGDVVVAWLACEGICMQPYVSGNDPICWPLVESPVSMDLMRTLIASPEAQKMAAYIGRDDRGVPSVKRIDWNPETREQKRNTRSKQIDWSPIPMSPTDGVPVASVSWLIEPVTAEWCLISRSHCRFFGDGKFSGETTGTRAACEKAWTKRMEAAYDAGVLETTDLRIIPFSELPR